MKKWVAGLLHGCTGVLLLALTFTSAFAQAAAISPWLTRDVASMGGMPLSLGCEKRGIYLDLVNTSLGFPLKKHFRLSQGGRAKIDRKWNMTFRSWRGGHSTLLTSLNQLRGLLQVADGQAALRLVRLRTIPSELCYAWDSEYREVEIVSASQVPTLPNFGLDDVAYRLPTFARLQAGCWGVLPDQDYRTAGFEATTVQPVRRGFEVVRWIYWNSGYSGWPGLPVKAGVQKVREFVDADGEYRRSILVETNAAKAPQLQIPSGFR